MEAAQEEAILRSKENNTHVVIKGKRTKRQRPRSPIPSIPSITANSPSHVDPDGEGGGGGGGGCDGGDQSNDITNDNMASFSPATSAEILQESTEEEEDMANCLILLAQGQSRESPKQVEEDHADGGGGVYKFNSRRFLEAAATGTGKAGYYVYECKTCKRTFPSFQALGGHRASHKKPKAAAMSAEEKSSKQLLLSSDEEEAQFKKNDHLSSISFQSSSRGLCGNNRSNKVHECSICGAEFTSGQALGGHMRRHRAPITGNKFNNTLTFTPPPMAPLELDQEPKKPRRTVLSLDLDLNLPAPEDDHREPKFPFATKQQQQQQQQQQQKQQQPPLVFSARTLVDCHY